MAQLRDRLRAEGYAIIVDAAVILIVRKEVESSLYADGKVLLKTTDRAAAETAYAALEPHLAACSD